MIHIEGDYYLDSDRFQFIICKKLIAKTGKNVGQEYYDPVAFCGNLFQVKNWLFNEEIRNDLDIIKNIEECVKLSNTIDKSLMGVGKK